MKSAAEIHERELQIHIQKLMSDPAVIFKTISGKRLQILSPGRLNVHPGPDFLDVALLLDGMVVVGDAEFHKKSSLWAAHNHAADERYRAVVLHIFLEKDSFADEKFEELLISGSEALNQYKISESDISENRDINSIDELQQYALIRLLRKTCDAQKILRTKSVTQAFVDLISEFLNRYYNRRKRPVYSQSRLESFVKSIPSSLAESFLLQLKDNINISVPDTMQLLLKTKLTDEGSHLRREIVLNCVLPLALCLADEESRINLFLWYWSTPSLSKYGALARRFEQFPQNFLWQQQGMLEFMREHGRKPMVVAETLRDYGFAEILSFYRVGCPPSYKY